ncbi:MAG: dethiobiotin synthase [Betaproteobacteria bacterium]|nr:dethiobiotin synthase [Betaproteobacteria bacterium]
MSKGYFITGTDTGVGKTFVSCALLLALRQRGMRVAAMKPVAAGVEPGHGMNEDVAAYMALTGNRMALRDINPYSLAEPIAPHIAAAREGIAIEPQVIAAAYRRLADAGDIVLVEGAGGFLVPMDEKSSFADLPRLLDLDIILVVGMRLGCLNHALLSAEAILSRGCTLAGWIANTPGETMNAHEENLATLQSRLPAPCLGVVPGRCDGPQVAAQHIDLVALNKLISRSET